MPVVTSAPGLRAQKKADNRRRMAECAFRLFVERGFDAVTVADIAATAGVSVTTLFSYFPVKESLVFDVDRGQAAALCDAVRNRAPDMTVVDAAEAHSLDTLGTTVYDRATREEYVHLLRETPSLQQHVVQTMQLHWGPELVTTLRETVPGLDQLEATIWSRHLLCAMAMVVSYLDADVVPQIFAPLRDGLLRPSA